LAHPSEQNHIYLGGTGLTAASEERHTLPVLMSILGGGMSSRLFQTVGEQRGLPYSGYALSAHHHDARPCGLHAARRPRRPARLGELMAAELTEMRRQGITEQELQRAKGQITGSFALGLEDTSSRMGRLGTIELVHGEYSSVDETLDKISRVGLED